MVSVLEGGEPTVITNTGGARTAPSVVAFSKIAASAEGGQVAGRGPALGDGVLCGHGGELAGAGRVGDRCGVAPREGVGVAGDPQVCADAKAAFLGRQA
ncbi:hypothetical protein BIV23_03560 [Streptomyces monashensis]|uniref:Uncharacterized protein n=1 Tax=Streptomyces monashensis TaxID=1678012 RepID=A0A1S2QN50_9ACTN|nr:hypothetical protein BIV23_03560 [Streptomyces monashensis]